MNTEIPPTVTPDALTAILHKRADKNLLEEIHKLTAPFDTTDTGIIEPPTAERLCKQVSQCKVYIPTLIVALRQALFSAGQENARAAEVAEFLAKVENTAAELDAIREEINQ